MRLVTLWFILFCGPVLQADILHLRDGSRQYGELLSESEERIEFRIVLSDGVSGLVRSWPRVLVSRLERTGRVDVTPGESAQPGPDDRDLALQMLREGAELLDDGDRRAALRAMQRGLRAAGDDRRPELEQWCQSTRGVALDVLLAATRLQAACQHQDGTAFKLGFTTDYERPALGTMLERYQQMLLEVICDGRTVAEWSDAREEYTQPRSDARRLVANAGRAAAVISARLRLDPHIADDAGQRRALHDRWEALTRLAGHVRALGGYTSQREDEGDVAARAVRPLPPAHILQQRPGAVSSGASHSSVTRGRPPAGSDSADAPFCDDKEVLP